MRKIISLRLGNGSLEAGFSNLVVTVYKGAELLEEIDTGGLPPNQEIQTTYQRWQWLYQDFIGHSSSFLSDNLGEAGLDFRPRVLEFSNDGIERGNQENATELPTYLLETLNKWLNSPEFQPIDQALRTNINTEDEVVFIIQTDHEILRKLPWQEWDFFKKYPKAEVALSAPRFSSKQKLSTAAGRVRILAIVGDCQNIDPEADLHTLRSNRQIDLEILTQPSRQQICDRLRDEQGWDILFYAGHSKSNAQKGWISINGNTKLEISELNAALQVAIENGLQLAIFNSCQGLGLVPQLELLGISQVIVMREQVQNRVAQEFLAEFIANFSKGKSFYLAVRKARERLKDIEDQYYCASWLPVVCQHWSVQPPTWEQLCNPPVLSPRDLLLRKGGVITFGLLIGMLVIVLRSFGLFQAWEFKAFDWLMRMRPDEGVDPRLLVVEATEEDINRYGYPLSDGTIAETIEVIKEHKPHTIGLSIFRDRPIKSGHQKLLNLLQNDDKLVALCNVKLTKNDPNQPGISSPPGLTEESLGFSNILLDKFDGVLRRNLLFMSSDLENGCTTRFSFGFQLASQYLSLEGIEPKTIDRNRVKLGDVIFERLQPNSGGYQKLDNRGFQILLNYRSSKNAASTISLSEVLENNFDPELIKGRIVIVGIVAPIYNPTAYSSTPYSNGVLKQMSGVNIQAQMTSQILSAVLDKRPLLWTLSPTGEVFWIIIWSLVGSGITIISLSNSLPETLRERKSFLVFIYTGVGVLVLYLVCFAFLQQGGWMPLVPTLASLGISSVGGWVLVKNWR